MQLSAALTAAYNRQIQLEFESAFVYLQMGADFEHRNFPGFASWMRSQSDEEQVHATKFINFVLARGGKVELREIPAPPATPATALEAFEVALQHEEKVSRAIHDLYTSAMGETDYSSLPLLQWFVDEQIEEENLVSGIVERLRLVGNDSTGLLFLDRELGQRPGAASGSASEPGA